MDNNVVGLFSIPVYKNQIVPTKEQIEVCDSYFDSIFKFAEENSWPGESGKTTGSYSLNLHDLPEFKWLFNSLTPHLNDYWWRVLNYHQTLIPQVVGSWANCHVKNQSTECHSHTDGYDGLNHISGVFYYKKLEEESNIHFINPLDSLLRCQPYNTMQGIEEISISIPTKQYDVLLFPSWLRHRVPGNIFESERIAISFNCRGVNYGTNNFVR